MHDRVERGFPNYIKILFNRSESAGVVYDHARPEVLLSPVVSAHQLTHSVSVPGADGEVQRFQRLWVYSQPDEVTCILAHWHRRTHV